MLSNDERRKLAVAARDELTAHIKSLPKADAGG